MSKTGYVNGSDLLLRIAGQYVGHCTSHSLTFNSETKDRAVKPVGTAAIAAGLWKEKGVTSLSVSISAEGICHYAETEGGFSKLLEAWSQGEPVEVEAYERGDSAEPYASGSFVIANIEQSAPAEDDATYSISLENNGMVIIDTSKLTPSGKASV